MMLNKREQLEQTSLDLSQGVKRVSELVESLEFQFNQVQDVQKHARRLSGDLAHSSVQVKSTVKDLIQSFENLDFGKFERENGELKERLSVSELKLNKASQEISVFQNSFATIDQTVKSLSSQINSLHAENQNLQLQVARLSEENSLKTQKLLQAQKLQEEMEFNQRQINLVLSNIISRSSQSQSSAKPQSSNALCGKQTRLRRHLSCADERQFDSVPSFLNA
jgi:chromosome segregation ATPase